MALVAVSLLLATQSYAGTTLNSNKSNNFKQTKQGGGTKPTNAASINASKSNNFRQGSASSGGGSGIVTVNASKSNTYRMGGGGGGKGASGSANRWPGATLNR
jgi:hypothetical protein